MAFEKEFKEALKEKKVLIGSNSVVRGICSGNVKAVIYASNCPESSLKELEAHTQIGNIEVEKFKGTSKDLGEFCGKPFNVLLVGLKK